MNSDNPKTPTTSDLATNISSHLSKMAKSHPYMNAVIFPEGRDYRGRVSYTHFTYRQLERETNLLAKGFIDSGIKKDSRTVLMAKPSLDFFASAFALFRIGAIPIMIDPGMGIKNIKKCLGEADPTAFIGIAKAHVARIILGWQRGKIKILIGVEKHPLFSKISLGEVRERGKKIDNCDFTPVSESDHAAILFTSGSTGVPKGALYTHKNFNAQISLLSQTYKIRAGEVDLCTFPLFALFAPALGMTAIIPDMDFTKPANVDPEKIFEAIANFGVTNMFGSPALLKRVARAAVHRRISLPTLKRVISAGAPVPYQTLRQLTKVLSPTAAIHTPYGATEALPICSISSDEILAGTDKKTAEGLGVCVGKPVTGVDVKIIKISDDAIYNWNLNLLIPDGEIGEIVVRGPQVTSSYFNRPESNRMGKIIDEETNQVLHRMGDLGYFDDQGRIWFCGRMAHRVITDHETLYTVPCESIYNTHELVSRTALVGIKSGATKIPVLCVETEANLTASEQALVKKDLLELGGSKTITKNITRILFHDSFPVDVRHNSKIFREKLQDWASSKLQSTVKTKTENLNPRGQRSNT